MMANFNKIILIGNLTQDIELRKAPSRTSVANMRLAINESFTDKAGERREGNAMFAFEDLDMRKSILYRTQRRRLVNTGLNANSEAVIELFSKERKAAAEAYVWAATPKPIDRYEEYEGVIYTYTQHLIDGYCEEEFGRYTEDLRFPSADAYNNWAYGTLKAGWPSDALGILQSALAINFESSYVWHTLSQTYEALGLESKMKWAMNEYKKIKSDK